MSEAKLISILSVGLGVWLIYSLLKNMPKVTIPMPPGVSSQ